jgi:non-heme chloroperoxidase
VRFEGSGKLSAKLVKGAKLQVISGAPHGMCATHKYAVNEALLEFIKG